MRRGDGDAGTHHASSLGHASEELVVSLSQMHLEETIVRQFQAAHLALVRVTLLVVQVEVVQRAEELLTLLEAAVEIILAPEMKAQQRHNEARG
jgi:hypothetical protein